MKSVGVYTKMETGMHRMLRMLRKHPKCRAVVYPVAEGRKGKRDKSPR